MLTHRSWPIPQSHDVSAACVTCVLVILCEGVPTWPVLKELARRGANHARRHVHLLIWSPIGPARRVAHIFEIVRSKHGASTRAWAPVPAISCARLDLARRYTCAPVGSQPAVFPTSDVRLTVLEAAESAHTEWLEARASGGR